MTKNSGDSFPRLLGSCEHHYFTMSYSVTEESNFVQECNESYITVQNMQTKFNNKWMTFFDSFCVLLVFPCCFGASSKRFHFSSLWWFKHAWQSGTHHFSHDPSGVGHLRMRTANFKVIGHFHGQAIHMIVLSEMRQPMTCFTTLQSVLCSGYHRPKPDETCCLMSISASLNSTSVTLHWLRLLAVSFYISVRISSQKIRSFECRQWLELRC